MLDQLVESRSNSQNQKSRGGYLFTTGFLVFSLFASGIMWSLFAQNLDIGGDALELSSIVPPVPMPDDIPPAPEPVRQVKQEVSPKVENTLPTRTANIARVDEVQQTPKEISTSPNTQMARPNSAFTVGTSDTNPTNGGGVSREGTGFSNDSGPVGVNKPKPVEASKEEEPPPVSKKPEPKVEKPTPPVSGGVMNGKAISLPIPAYPPPARAIGATGDVNVQVTIDEDGKVISAKAITGHALLRSAAENAARGAKFSPTYLSKVPVKVTGIIVYKFSK